MPFGGEINNPGHKKKREEVFSKEGESLVSGWFDLEIYIKTPLIIPGKFYKDNGKRKCAFLKLPDGDGTMQYAIPASKLRGIIRSAFEAATDSCVPFVLREKNRMSQRIPKFGALHDRGLLCYENGIWSLYEGEVVAMEKVEANPERSGFHYPDDREVTVKTGDYDEKKHGVVQYNFPVNTGKPYHIAYLQKGKLINKWNSNEPYDDLSSVLGGDSSFYGKKIRNINIGPVRDLRNALDRELRGEGHGVPVYYFCVSTSGDDDSMEDRIVYLSNASVGRIPRKRSWKEVMGDYVPCEVKEGLCPACLLFGTKEGEEYKSRLRFTDAFPASDISSEYRLINALGLPKYTAFEYYLKKPAEDAVYWNYDIYGVKGKRIGGKTSTKYRYLKEVSPRGRKFYWHFNPSTDAPLGKFPSEIEMMTGGTFHSRIYFDSITKQQLDDLMWVISFGDNKKDSNLCYKLGHARPHGYGSCKFVISSLNIRTISKDEKGDISFSVKSEVPEIKALSYGIEKENVRALLKMADLNALADQNVDYPGELEKSFYWFSKNHKNRGTMQVLHDALDSELSQKNHVKPPKPQDAET